MPPRVARHRRHGIPAEPLIKPQGRHTHVVKIRQVVRSDMKVVKDTGMNIKRDQKTPGREPHSTTP